eukprot:6241599-Amphidinium_carterae.1
MANVEWEAGPSMTGSPAENASAEAVARDAPATLFGYWHSKPSQTFTASHQISRDQEVQTHHRMANLTMEQKTHAARFKLSILKTPFGELFLHLLDRENCFRLFAFLVMKSATTCPAVGLQA